MFDMLYRVPLLCFRKLLKEIAEFEESETSGGKSKPLVSNGIWFNCFFNIQGVTSKKNVLRVMKIDGLIVGRKGVIKDSLSISVFILRIFILYWVFYFEVYYFR